VAAPGFHAQLIHCWGEPTTYRKVCNDAQNLSLDVRHHGSSLPIIRTFVCIICEQGRTCKKKCPTISGASVSYSPWGLTVLETIQVHRQETSACLFLPNRIEPIRGSCLLSSLGCFRQREGHHSVSIWTRSPLLVATPVVINRSRSEYRQPPARSSPPVSAGLGIRSASSSQEASWLVFHRFQRLVTHRDMMTIDRRQK
jgi:hypothetical protein